MKSVKLSDFEFYLLLKFEIIINENFFFKILFVLPHNQQFLLKER